LEALQGANGQNPGSENLEDLTEKVSRVIKGINMMSLRSERRKLGLQRIQLGNPLAANLGRFKAIKQKTIKSGTLSETVPKT
jgi:hypothetical protein